MTELSTVNLYEPVPSGAAFIGDISDLVWPTWRRTSLAAGGDHMADFMIDSSSHPVTRQYLEYAFHNWIGCHVVETFAGVTVFQGFINSIRLYAGGNAWTISMENMANYVQVIYQTDSTAAATITASSTDTGSIARYGTKGLIMEPMSFMTQTYAEARRDNYLTRFAYPRAYSNEIVPDEDGDIVMEVEVVGYVHTLDWVYARVANAAAANQAIYTQISAMIAARDYVSEGALATAGDMATSITNETDYVTVLRRINDLMQDIDFTWGCLQGRTFDIKAHDVTTIKYRRRAYGGRKGLFSESDLYVPDPLVVPGGVVFTEDVFAALPVQATLLNDPRAAWIASVEYSIDGVRLMAGEEPDDAFDTASVALAMKKELDEADKTQPYETAAGRTGGWRPTTERVRG